MKIYLIKQEDLDRLMAFVDRAPEHGYGGGSSRVLSPVEQEAHGEAHSFFNLQIRRWITEVSK